MCRLTFFCLTSHISSVLLCAFVPLNIDLVKIKPMTHLDVKLVVPAQMPEYANEHFEWSVRPK